MATFVKYPQVPNIKESSIEISVSSIGEFCIITYTVLYYLKYIFFDPI